jgi:transcriptional regulator with XRE-family HTH domain
MRSSRRTTTAVLRLAIGLSAQEFSLQIGKSLPTVKSLESGKLALSEATAAVISQKTGISLGWLLAGDTSAPMIDLEGKPWTIDNYERARAQRMRGMIDLGQVSLRPEYLIERTRSLLENQKTPEEFLIVWSRINLFLEKLEKQFGTISKKRPPGRKSARS